MVDLTLTGAGTVGEIQTWNVQYEATPVSVGDSSGSTGSVNVTVAHGEDSEFVINNTSVFTHPVFGSITGQVAQLNSNGSSEATDTNLPLQLSNALTPINRDVTASMVVNNNALDLFAGMDSLPFTPIFTIPGIARWDLVRVNQNSDGSTTYLYPTSGTVMTMTRITSAGVATTFATGIPASTYGSAVGFVSDASLNYYVAIMIGSLPGTPRIYKLSSSGAVLNAVGATGSGNGQYGVWPQFFSNFLAINPAGTSLFVIDTGAPNNRVQVLGTAALAYSSQFSLGGTVPTAITANATYVYTVTANSSTGSTVTAFTHAGVNSGNTTVSGNFSGMNCVAIEQSAFTSAVSGSESKLILVIADAPGNNITYIGGVTTRSGLFVGVPNPQRQKLSEYTQVGAAVADASLGSTYLRMVLTPNTSYPFPVAKMLSDGTKLSGLIGYYLALAGVYKYSYVASTDPAIVAQGWSGNLWTRLKDLLSAYQREIVVINDVITVRNVGTTTISMENAIAGSVSLTVDSRQSGAFVNINNYNTVSDSFTVFNNVGSTDRITFPVGVTSSSISISGFPTGLADNPTFSIRDSTGLDVTNALTSAGMTTSFYVNKLSPGALFYTVSIPAGVGTGPFELYNANFTGYGISVNPIQYTIPTGGDAAKTFSENVKDIDNIFIDGLNRMYNAVNRYSADAAGGVGVLNFTLPATDLSTYAIPGYLVPFKESIYRIVSVDINASTARITARHFVTTEAFDSNVSGKTTGQFDAFWAPNDSLDVKIKPLRPIV